MQLPSPPRKSQKEAGGPMAKPRKITEKEIYGLTELVEAERSCCPTETEVHRTATANVLHLIVEKMQRDELLSDEEVFALGRNLFILCRRSSTESDPLLSLLAGWREGEMEQHREDLRLLY